MLFLRSSKSMSKLSKTLLAIAGISLLLNIVWENLQAPLYQDYINFWQHLPICSVASLGDVLIILILYFMLAILNRDMFWIAKISKTDVVIMIVFGVLVAVGIEKWALGTARWGYASTMPLIPYSNIGLLPILQMIILPWATYRLARKYI